MSNPTPANPDTMNDIAQHFMRYGTAVNDIVTRNKEHLPPEDAFVLITLANFMQTLGVMATQEISSDK